MVVERPPYSHALAAFVTTMRIDLDFLHQIRKLQISFRDQSHIPTKTALLNIGNEAIIDSLNSEEHLDRYAKKEAERIVDSLADQVNQSSNEIYRFIFKFAVDKYEADGVINTRQLLAPTMKRLRR